MSQNTPSNSPLIYIEKNKNKNLFNKDDKNTIEDEELLKATPHFINDNRVSCESLKENDILRRPLSENIDETVKKLVKAPLTCDNKCYNNYKFNFNFEIKDNGEIVPHDKKDEKKSKKISNAFRIGNKNNNLNKNKISKNYKQDFSCKKVYSSKDNEKNKIDNSPMNSPLISLKYNINQATPMKSIKNKENNKFNKNIYNSNKLNNDNSHNNIKNKNNSFIDNQKKLKRQRPKSVKNISPQKRNSSNNNKIKDISKDKKINIERKKSCHSVNKTSKTILPYLAENKIIHVKNKLQTEFKNLVEILPENYEEDPEIKNNLNLIFQDIYGLKDYIHKNNQCTCRTNKCYYDKQ